MTDVFTREKRSQVMAQIKSGGNKATECVLAAIFRDLHMADGAETKNCLGNRILSFASLGYASS